MSDPDSHEDVFEQLSAETDTEADDPFSELDKELFTQVEVAKADDETVWDELSTRKEIRITDSAGEREVAIVPKHSYCEQCAYFTAPPEVACTHEEAEIVEQTDMRHFKLSNCPVVEQRRELEDRR